MMTRRRLLQFSAGGLGLALLAGCGSKASWHAIDVSNTSPDLDFTMFRAPDGKQVSATDYRGQVVMLYLGYTFCPDVCPTTLANVAEIFHRLGPDASRISLLFVTVDPSRDTLPILAQYVASFSPRIVGLRGTDDELAALARRYRLVYSVTPASPGHPYEVTHSSAIYVFDQTGAARLLLSNLATNGVDMNGTEADLKRLLAA
ncbi:MAG: SCO family protein [Devosia sp.]